MSGRTRSYVGFAQAHDAQAEKSYREEIESLSSRPPEEAREAALKIVRRLAYTSWQTDYGTKQNCERFNDFWSLVFPEQSGEKKGGKK
jgi:hypothetical protein